jgi:hypothetical protein
MNLPPVTKNKDKLRDEVQEMCVDCGRPVIKDHGYAEINIKILNILSKPQSPEVKMQTLLTKELYIHKSCIQKLLWKHFFNK